MSSINPMDFTKSFLKETRNYMASKGEKSYETDTTDMWINSYLGGETEKLPTAATFARDMEKLKSDDPSGQSNMLYCGLALLASAVNAAQVGSMSPGSPLFAQISGTVGKSLLTPEIEKEIGKANDTYFAEKVGFSEDPKMNERINRVGKMLLKESKLPEGEYDFRILKDAGTNAFTSPGHIYVTEKMMDILPKDEHLAFFLGHEIGHLEDQDHGETLGQNQFSSLIKSGTLMLKGAPMKGKTVGDFRREALGDFKASVKEYDFQNEFAADKRGVEIMAKAGFNAELAIEAIELPLKALEAEGKKWDPEKATHPDPVKRQEAIRETVDNLS